MLTGKIRNNTYILHNILFLSTLYESIVNKVRQLVLVVEWLTYLIAILLSILY